MKTFNMFSAAVITAAFAIGLAGPIAALAAGPAAVDLGTAGNFVILAKTGISTTGVTSITGDIGVSPAAASYLTGFGLILPAAGAYSTSALITGKAYASDYAAPTPATLTTAVLDMQTAYTDARSRAANYTDLLSGNIGAMTLAPGTYKWTTGLTIPTDVTLSGGADDVWIFQVAQNLDISAGQKIILTGGAQADHVFWAVAGQTTINTTATFNGNILDQTAIILKTGAVLNGRALAQTAVTLDSNSVMKSTTAAAVPAVPAVPATPAVPDVTPAVPATPATPAVPASIVIKSTEGEIIKVNAKDRPAVYYVDGGKKYLFVNRATYTTWSKDAGDDANKFATLKTVTQAEFDAIPTGGNLVAKAGSLIKFDSSPKIYGVATDGKLYEVTDVATQTKLYGTSTPITIQSGFRDDYNDHGNAVGTLTEDSELPE